MDKLKKEIKLENLIKRKQLLLQNLEWTLLNADIGLQEVVEVELKAVLKSIERTEKELNL